MANEHDRRYKKLFSHPLLFQELLESFVDEEFVKDLDFSTLNRLDKSFITDDFIEQTIPARYIPRFSYFPVLENTFPPEVLLQIKNVVSAVFFVENTGVESLSKELNKLYTLLKGEKHEIIELFIRWLKNYLEKTAEADNIDMGPLEDLEEVHNMFATSLEKHDRRIAEKAIQQGIEQGIEQGVEQGKQQMLLRFAEKKFQLTDSERKTIQTTTDSDKLDRAFDVLINAKSFEEVKIELK